MADGAIQTALDYGVNHIDVAPRYGDAELRLKPWMPRMRDTIFLGCKTAQRTRDGARADLCRSLERLGTDRLDLYQCGGDRALAGHHRPVTTLCSVGDATVLPKFLAAAERYRPLSPEAEAALLATAPRYHSPFVGAWA